MEGAPEDCFELEGEGAVELVARVCVLAKVVSRAVASAPRRPKQSIAKGQNAQFAASHAVEYRLRFSFVAAVRTVRAALTE